MKKGEQILYTTKDYLVSGESFSIVWNEEKQYGVTHPIPKEEELGTYYNSDEYSSHSEKKKNVSDVLYSIVRNYMLSVKLKMIKNVIPAAANILDYGCGTGNFISFLKNKKYNVKGIEINSKARKQSINKNLLVFPSWDDLPVEKFDLITFWHVLEHVFDIDSCMRNIKQRLNSKGHLLVAVPNLNSFDAEYYKEYWAAYDVPRHLWHFSQKGLCNLVTPYGFTLVDKHPLIFDALYVSYISEKHQGSKFPLIKGLIKGLNSNIKARKSGEYSSLVYVFKKAE